MLINRWVSIRFIYLTICVKVCTHTNLVKRTMYGCFYKRTQSSSQYLHFISNTAIFTHAQSKNKSKLEL